MTWSSGKNRVGSQGLVPAPGRPSTWILLCISSLANVVLAMPSSADSIRSVAMMQQGLSNYRPLELRLSLGFGYRPCVFSESADRLLPESSCSDRPRPDAWEFRRLQDIEAILAGGSQDEAPERMHLRASLNLGWQDARALDHAIELLQHLTTSSPNEADFWSDLAAAFYRRAHLDDQPYDLLLALDAADKAAALAPTSPIAGYNKARTLQSLALWTAAEEAWKRYVQLDPSSGWTKEALGYLGRIQQAESGGEWDAARSILDSTQPIRGDELREIIRRFPQESRELGERELLARWADAHLAGRNAEALGWMERVRQIGQGLKTLGGDTVLHVAVQVIEDGHQNTLALGHQRFLAGFRAYRSGDHALAHEALEDAAERLSSSPFALWAIFYRACAYYNANAYSESLKTLDKLWTDDTASRYPSLAAHIQWMKGLNLLVLGRPAVALSHYRQGETIFRRLGEPINTAILSTLQGEAFDLLGLDASMWTALHQGLKYARRIQDVKRRFIVYSPYNDALERRGLHHLAIYFQEEVVRAARASGNTSRLSNALQWRGRLHHLRGDGALGNGDFAESRRLLEGIPNRDDRRRRLADLSTLEALSLFPDDPDGAWVRVNEAIATHADLARVSQLSLQAYRLRSEIHRQEGELQGAEADLQQIADTYWKRSRLGAETQNITWLVRRQKEAVFDQLIQSQLDRGKPIEAYLTAEKEAQTQLPHLSWRADLPPLDLQALTPAAVQSSLHGVRVVRFVVLPDQLAVWWFDAETSAHQQRRVPRDTLRHSVERFRSAVRGDRLEALDAASADLHRLVAGPWIEDVEAGRPLVLVLDDVLFQVPWAALRTRHGSFLGERHPIVVSHSAEQALHCQRGARQSEAGIRALLMGNPHFDQQIFPLDRLPNAEREIREISTLYAGHRPIVGEDGTRERFLLEAPAVEVIHFSGHGLKNDHHPRLSALLAAPSADSMGLITAEDLGQLHLPRCRLAVLSACESGGAFDSTSTWVQSLMMSGCPSVIGTLDRVEDAEVDPVSVGIHRRWLQQRNAPAALRQTILDLFGDSEQPPLPAYWALFQTFGSICSFH